MQNIINPQNTILATLMSISSLFLWSNPSLAAIRSYTVGHDYGGVHRCGSAQENISEARQAAVKKVRELIADTGFRVTLKNFRILSHNTRRWVEKDRFGFVKGRKCKTHLEVRVVVDMQP
ncbi:MAG: hypothetical protein QNJ47_21035 [Nostocaceae cyanobacterium]|nr:hypothetical protein [Nostocaceae cyanobacterium]